ncbi:MAG: hypothetical protein ACJAVV_001263 [Alphaproteobacteria bacterium]|jgi:hypothetical protein
MVSFHRNALLWISLFIFSGLAANALSQESNTDQNRGSFNLTGKERFEIGEELIMSLQVDNWRLTQMVVENSKYGVKVNFDELIEALDFPIESTSSLQYEGWYISEEKVFSLTNRDTDNNLHITLADASFELTPEYYSIQNNELYIEMREIAKWFKLNPSIDYIEQIIMLAPTEELPIQEKTKRQNRKLFKSNGSSESSAPFLDRGYSLLSAQAIDFQANISTNDRGTSGNYTLLGAREIFKHNVKLYLNGNDKELVTTSRLSVSKYSPEGWSVFNPVNITSYSLGDITPTRVGSLGTNQLSRGLTFGNSQFGSAINNEFTNISGDVLPGWDVELYRGEVLIEQLFDIDNGRYEFNDVPLLIGENTFEIVFYGPQGQIKRETVNRSLTTEKLNTQNFAYSMSVNEIGKTLLKNNSVGLADEDQGYNFSGEYSFKVGDDSRFKFGHQNIIGSSNDQSIFALGFNTQLTESLLLNADASINDNKDYILGVNARTKINDQSIRLNLNSRRTTNSENQEKSSSSVISLLSTGQILKMDSIGIRHQTELQFTDTPLQDTYEASTNLGVNVGKAYFYGGAEYQYRTMIKESLIFGNLGYQQNFKTVFAKLQLGFKNDEVEDKVELSNLFSSLTWLVSSNIKTKFEYSKSLIDDSDRVDLSIDWKKDRFSLSADISESSLFGTEFGLYARFNFSGTPYYGSYLSSNRSLTNTGSLLVRVFVDENGNYAYDIGEKLLEKVKVFSLQSRGLGITDDNGMASLLSLSAHKMTDIVIDKNSLDDPYLTPYLDGISVTPRPGFVDQIDFPVAISSELDGTIYTTSAEKGTLVGNNIKIGLYNHLNRLTDTTRAEFDGFYLFTHVLPGKYHIRILPESLDKHLLEPTISEEITFTPQGDVINGFDIIANKKVTEKVYLVKHGNFPNKRAMALYWQLKKQKLLTINNNKPITFMVDKKSGKRTFVLLTSTSRNLAYDFCNDLMTRNITCSVTEKIEIRE